MGGIADVLLLAAGGCVGKIGSCSEIEATAGLQQPILPRCKYLGQFIALFCGTHVYI
jgi:hypothetical protein